MFNVDDFKIKFFEMEKNYSLFEYEVNGISSWDVIRFFIYERLYNELNEMNELKIEKSVNKLSLFKYLKIFKYFLNIQYSLKKKDYIFLSSSRNRDNSSKLIDAASNDFKNSITGSIIDFETFSKEKKLYLPYHKVILSKFFLNKNITLDKYNDFINYIVNILNSEFNIKIKKLKCDLIVEFKKFEIEKKYFKYLIKKIRPKVIFLTQNGIQKGLINASLNLDVPVVEFQHGNIVDVNLAYSYPDKCNYSIVKTLPSVLLLFSEYWRSQFYMPLTKIISIGNNYFSDPLNYNYQNSTYNKKDYILIISSMIHQNSIEEIIYQYRIIDKKSQIVLKLHPNQSDNYRSIINKFKHDEFLDVTLNEYSISSLIKESKMVILIQTTAAYEVLNLGKTLAILKKDNYLGHKDIFPLNGVALIEEATELKKIIDNIDSRKTRSLENKFFMPFDNKTATEIVSGLINQ